MKRRRRRRRKRRRRKRRKRRRRVKGRKTGNKDPIMGTYCYMYHVLLKTFQLSKDMYMYLDRLCSSTLNTPPLP